MYRPGAAGPPIEQAVGMVGHFVRLCSDSQAMGIMAVSGLKDEVQRKPAEVIKDLEDQLEKTRSLTLRNAIRLTLKDLYKQQKQEDKVLEHLRALLAENDKAGQAAAEKK